MSNSEDLEALFPLARETMIAGVSVALGPLKVRQFGAFTKVAEPFAGHVISGDYLAAVVQHPDAVIAALEIATGQPAAVFDDMLPDEIMSVLAEVMEINLRFFGQRLLPMRDQLRERMRAIAEASTGQPPSPVSSAGDTTSPPSES
ncbi:hypothetical protein ACTTAI_13360 [Rhodobacter capsulatus]|uniref:hypothetical protein n=1 Tax=Rhodobacter capsulatus TaxID=1061 RepID=UPI0040256822